jgi:hypothetical protein
MDKPKSFIVNEDNEAEAYHIDLEDVVNRNKIEQEML